MIIREIEKRDNKAIGKVIRKVLRELNVPKVGTAYADPQLNYMFEAYNCLKASYFVVERDGKIIGGAGVMQLENETRNICELQKMYFLPEGRGLGLGKQMMEICLARAKELGFESCYLETMPYMEDAQKLYISSGFEYLCEPLGNTGHTSCPVWMIRKL
jgi:putative acetyltransferase